MPYVVKAYAYLDKCGYPTNQIEKAEKFEDEELAELAADACGGIYTEVKRVVPIKNKVENKKPVDVEKPKKTKQNQSWMKAGGKWDIPLKKLNQ